MDMVVITGTLHTTNPSLTRANFRIEKEKEKERKKESNCEALPALFNHGNYHVLES